MNLSPISFDLILEKKFHLMEITQTEIEEIKKFVSDLNKESSPIIVEGKKDTSALKSIGVMGKIFELNKFQGMADFSDHVSKFEKIIILFERTLFVGREKVHQEREVKHQSSFKGNQFASSIN